MNNQHVTGISEEELLKGLKPLMSHAHWSYLEEYLRRQMHKQVKILSTQDSHVALARAQGQFAAYKSLSTLKPTIMK